MLPKNGCSGILMPSAKFATIRSRSSGMIFIFDCPEILRQKSAGRPERIVRIRNRQLDGHNAHLQRVPRFGAFNVNRPGQNVPARPLVRHLRRNVPQRLLHLVARHARALHARRTRRDERLHLHRVAGFDAQHRRAFRVITPPDHRFRRRFQFVKRAFFPAPSRERRERQGHDGQPRERAMQTV